MNWDYLDEILPELYEFQINQTEEWIPEICYSLCARYTEENYEYIEAIWDYFRSEEWKENYMKWRCARKGTYDEMYYFLQRHPEWKDLVYYDENSPKPEVY